MLLKHFGHLMNFLNKEGDLLQSKNICMNCTYVLLLFTQLLPRDGGMAEDHGAPEIVERQRVAKE